MKTEGTMRRNGGVGTLLAVGVLSAAGAVGLAPPAAAAVQSEVQERLELQRQREALERALAEQRRELARRRAETGRAQHRALEEQARAMAEVRMALGAAQREAREVRLQQSREVREALERARRAAVERDARRWRRVGTPGAEAPEAWLGQDPADSLYRAARGALNGGRYDEAARLFAQIREDHPRSGYVADSYYFQAMALQRAGGTRNLRLARELLAAQEQRHREAATAQDARQLAVRLQGQLARLGDAESAARIQERAAAGCETEDQELRTAALSALLQMDSERAVPILQEVLRSRDECSSELRKRAVFLVAQKMTPETVDILLDLAHENPDPDPEVREAAVFWLSQVRSEEAVRALEAILADSDDPKLQERAVFAISQHPSERASAILRGYAERSDAPRDLREKAIFWIGQRGDASSGDYLRQLYGRLDDVELRKKVIFGVAQSPTESDRRWLLDLARNPDQELETRKDALFWAGQSGRIGVEDLQGLYQTLPDRELKEQVIFALAHDGSRASVTALMEIAEGEEDTELRERAVFWLGQSDDDRVPEFLLRIIRGGQGG